MTTASHPSFEPGRPFTEVSRFLSRCFDTRSARARQPAASVVSLARGQCHAVTGFQGGSIECTQGCVWLTHDGDCRDILLEAGQSHLADRDSRLVIYAMGSASVRLLPTAALAR